MNQFEATNGRAIRSLIESNINPCSLIWERGCDIPETFTHAEAHMVKVAEWVICQSATDAEAVERFAAINFDW